MAENENTNNQEETKVNDPVPDNENINEKVKTDEESDKESQSVEPNCDKNTDKKSRKWRLRHGNDKAVEEEKAKNAELQDKYIRLVSEFDNFRKRTAKEKLEISATAAAIVIKDLLPVLDDFERAIQNMEKNGNEADLQGVTLIYNKLKNTLKAAGLEEINAMGSDFSTDEHEALTQIPAPDESHKGKVLDVIQKGYKLNGKVIRFARVVVGN